MSSRTKLSISVSVMVAVYWVSVGGYVVLDWEHVTVLNAMYMVAITISTVGYKEAIDLGPNGLGAAGQIWTIMVILMGATSAMITLSFLTTMMVEGELGYLMGSRKVETRIKALKNHVVVCGYGRMGQMLVHHLLSRKIPLVVVESDPSHAQLAAEMKQPYVLGDATDETSLEKAGIERARQLVAVLRSDADNVFVTLTARQMNPDLYIVARAEQMSAEPKLRHAGANRVVSPQAIGAERIANVLTRPSVVDLMEMTSRGVELEVDEFRVPGDSPIAGKTLGEANIRQAANVSVVVIKSADGSARYNPGASEVIHANDTLILIGRTGAASRLEELRIVEQAPAEG